MGQSNTWRHLLYILTIISVTLSLSGCLFTYLVRSSWEQTLLLTSRRPIETVIADPKVDAETKKKLNLALQVREFAESRLSFKPSKNYRTYVDLKRPYVTWIVTVAHRNKLESHFWNYPIVGKLPYKGYFNEESAKDEAANFDEKLYDTYVRGVTAYSTLGWFEDPILSSMLRGNEPDLVELVLHESAHATIFFKDQADFNERIATFMGMEGTRIYYLEKEGEKSETLKSIANEAVDEKIFSEFISKEVLALKEWYNSVSEPAEAERQKKFQAIIERFNKNIEPKLKTNRWKFFPKMKLNNASLLGLSTYIFDLSDFQKLFEKSGRDFKTFLAACEGLKSSADPNKSLKDLVSSQ